VPEIIYYVASSVDGYIATPGDGLEWLASFEGGDEDYGYGEFYASVDAVLLGARTYEQVLILGDWPHPGKPTWVFSARALEVVGPDLTVTRAGPAQVAAELDARGIRRAWLVGGGKLAASFRAAGLITEYIVSTIPVILGSGILLLGAPGPQQRLRLVTTRSYAGGLVQSRYVPLDEG
jgi:dihydrofolate reductase